MDHRYEYIRACIRSGMTEEEALCSMMEYYFSPQVTEEDVDLGLDPNSEEGLWNKMLLEHRYEWEDTKKVA